MQMPVVTVKVEFAEPYNGFWALLRTNVRYGTKLDLSSGERDKYEAAVKAIIREWNFTDEDGAPVAVGDLGAIPDDLLSELVSKWVDALSKGAELPKA
jgi:hypothetical protein